MRRSALIAILFAAISGTACAGEKSFLEALNGTYVSLTYGMASVNGDIEYPLSGGGTLITSYDPDDGEAWGGTVGYNFRSGDLLYGPELRYLKVNGVQQDTVDFFYTVDLRGRLGYAFGNTTVYGALGWTWARMKVHPRGFDSVDLNGVNLGLGIEYDFSEHFYVGADYTTRDLSGDFGGSGTPADVTADTATLFLGYRF